MSRGSAADHVAAILLDIEGTTTPIAFVETVLFPYARARLASHLERHAASPAYDALLVRLRDEHAASARSGETPPPWRHGSQSENVASAAAFCGSAGAWSWPVGGEVLRPFTLGADAYAAGQHRGIDVAGPDGSPVRAPASGLVTFAGSLPTYGGR